MDSKEIELCWDLLAWAAKVAEEKAGTPSLDSWLLDAVAGAQSFGGLITSDTISAFRKKAGGRLAFGDGHFLLLEPDTKGQRKLPLLKVSHEKNSEGHEVIRYQVCLFVMDEQAKDRESAICAIGLRFDTPEGVDGIHAYYHAQWCREFHGSKRNLEFPRCPLWLPVTSPAIPVAASGPFSLMVAMFISLYGGTFSRKIARDKELVSSIQELAKNDKWLKTLLS